MAKNKARALLLAIKCGKTPLFISLVAFLGKKFTVHTSKGKTAGESHVSSCSPIAEGIGWLLTRVKWLMVACILAAVLSPSFALARTQSSVSARSVEQTVRAKFANAKVLIQVARCESRFRHYDSRGRVLRNAQGSSAVGVMQIMSSVHKRTAEKLGYDIYTLDGNLGYALYLYKHQGTAPWNESKHCWG